MNGTDWKSLRRWLLEGYLMVLLSVPGALLLVSDLSGTIRLSKEVGFTIAIVSLVSAALGLRCGIGALACLCRGRNGR